MHRVIKLFITPWARTVHTHSHVQYIRTHHPLCKTPNNCTYLDAEQYLYIRCRLSWCEKQRSDILWSTVDQRCTAACVTVSQIPPLSLSFKFRSNPSPLCPALCVTVLIVPTDRHRSESDVTPLLRIESTSHQWVEQKHRKQEKKVPREKCKF